MTSDASQGKDVHADMPQVSSNDTEELPEPLKIAPLAAIKEEVESNTTFHSQISALTQAFIRYLREPRYQAPLSLDELKILFNSFYDDLVGLIVNIYTQSNSCKKKLISQLKHFSDHPLHYDYLLAIANYSLSSIKLSKRTDNESLMQLRVFNYYKYLTVVNALEAAHRELFNASILPDGVLLHEKLHRFDNHDIVFQEFLDDKLVAMRDIPFEMFSEGEPYPLSDKETEVEELLRLLQLMKTKATPREKLNVVVQVQQRLIELLSSSSTTKSSKEISADHLLPILIYFLVRHGSNCDLYLTFMFIKNFLNLLDPNSIDPQHFNTHSSFSNYAPETRLTIHKKRARKLLFECLNINTDDNEYPVNNIDFFDSDKKLAAYIQAEQNNGELMYYLTNFEAALFFLLNVTGDELQLQDTAEILSTSIIKLVEKEMLAQFKFPDIVKSENNSSSSSSPVRLRNHRSRSTSLLNAISSRLSAGSIMATRLRSNSGANSVYPKKESFPTIEMVEDDGSLLMRNLITRFSLVSVPQFRTPTSEGDADSIDVKLDSERTNLVDEHVDLKRNPLTAKFSTGVTEFMTRLGLSQSQNQSVATIPNHNSQTSLELKGTESARSRTTSIQIMDRWFGAISQSAPEVEHNDSTVESQEESSVFSAPFRELTKYQDTDFDSLTIQDLRTLKTYYDQLCTEIGDGKTESKTTGDTHSIREGL